MDPIEVLYNESKDTLAYLRNNGEISLLASAERNFTKAFLLAIASFFEDEIKQRITEFCACRSENTVTLVKFVENTAISMRYHTFFEWKTKNVNNFLGLFGNEFKETVDVLIKSDEKLKEGIEAFMELGRLRNQLVHQNFVTFPLAKTLDDIYELYKRAMCFVNVLPQWFEKYCGPLGKG